MAVRILGISAYYHDAAASLVEDGRIVAAAQQERFSRVKGDASFPHDAIAYCLDEAGVTESQLDHIVFYEDPAAKFERLLVSYQMTAPWSLRSFLRAMPDWLTRKLWLGGEIAHEMGVDIPVRMCDHHLSHAASAFYPSPFDEAAIITVDGVGEWATATWGTGRGNAVELSEEIRYPNSMGLLYSAFTYYCGFKVNLGEYKLMGLAPYGEPVYADTIRDDLVHIGDDGSFILNQDYFDYAGGLKMINSRFCDLFGGPPREPESKLEQRHMDLARSIQEVLTGCILSMCRHVKDKTGMADAVLAGGVALNVVSAGRLMREGIFDRVWIQPAAGDAGGALGAALWMWHDVLGNERTAAASDSMEGALLGPAIDCESDEDDAALGALGAVWKTLDDDELASLIAGEVASGKVVAVARGRSEFGPRALGARSILGDARSPDMQRHMNMKIKFRESFRPFAPVVLAEDAAEWFDGVTDSPYMLVAFDVAEPKRASDLDEGLEGLDKLKAVRSEVPAVTHVDGSSRVQTVDAVRHPFLHDVLTRFKEATGVPVMINTSFNVRSEPIVNTAADAYRTFMATDIDILVVGGRLLKKEDQPVPQGEGGGS